MQITESKLLQLTSSLLLDFLCWNHKNEIDMNFLTVADLRNHCREWIKQNVKEFNSTDKHPEFSGSFSSDDVKNIIRTFVRMTKCDCYDDFHSPLVRYLDHPDVTINLFWDKYVEDNFK